MIEQLQALVPRRCLSRYEAMAVAELQAARLRRALKIDEACFSDKDLRALPTVRVEPVNGLGVSGATRRVGNLWIILVNQGEAEVRQRFTIAHEIKHILDDQATVHLHRRGLLASGQNWLTERICNYFAANLLMPRLWVKRAWVSTSQDPMQLARLFEVSADAMRFRLEQLGLADPVLRCASPEFDPVQLPARASA
jgi:predicted transcriptional regulator